MNKTKRLAALALALLLLLCACRKTVEQEAPEYPFSFYYCREETQWQEDGVICAELRSIDTRNVMPMQWLKLYFAGPQEHGLQSVFPEGTEALDFYSDHAIGYLMLSEEAAALDGVERTLAYACIAKTLLGLSELQAVSITVEGAGSSAMLYGRDIVLHDAVLEVQTCDVAVYFADTESGLLRAQYRQVTGIQRSALPQYAMELLLQGPTQDSLLRVLPEGAELLAISLSDGVCTVDFSEALLAEDVTEEQRRTAIRAIAATLCDLEGVSFTRITVAGEELWLDESASSKGITPAADWFAE